MINNKNTSIKTLFLLLFITVITLNSHAQKIKTYYINAGGEKCSKDVAKFKRTVQDQNNIWVIKDYYLNDSIQMTGNFIDKNLTKKTDTFRHYYPNGKLSSAVIYKNDLKHGIANFYYITGKLSKSANYSIDVPTGKWIWYNEDGSIENELDSVNPNILDENYAHPAYVGGQMNFKEYFKNIDYSEQKGIITKYDKAITTFQINEEGNVTDVDIIVHGTEEVDTAIIKHLYNMPKWRAEKKNGKYVTSNFVLPIQFSNKGKYVLSEKIIGEAFFKSGLDDYKAEQYEKAIFKLIHAIGNNHMEARYYYLLGHSFNKLKKQDFACENWTIANSLDNKILEKEIKDLCNLK